MTQLLTEAHPHQRHENGSAEKDCCSSTGQCTSKAACWAGLLIGGLPALFLLAGGIMNLFKPEFVVKGTTAIGYSESVIIPLGVVVLISSLLYLIPRTAVLGAILLTGYLGGAVATHVLARHAIGQTLFPVAFGVLFWLGLVLRDRRIRALLPLRANAA